MMTAERWKQIKTIYQQAVETASENRADLLNKKCGDDIDLRNEIESMLRFESGGEDFIEEPAFNVAAKLITQDEIFPRGKRIDNYEIGREIGRGGMGAVYLATRIDGLFEQRVALKIIKRGMDTDAILKRFVMERQILASLDHPNIAHLLDGGTTDDGLPYFAMEYVEGKPVHIFCGEGNLNLTERLQLFRKVCAAVSYAHQNLVVHRDLKPSNILVTKAGEPKLLDFGIAKLLHTDAAATGETKATETINRLLTPEYASPEQFQGNKITTQSDVYSLGVLLKKLIFGNSENSKTGNPQKPITSRTFDKDLQAILQTALRQEPARRYSTVEAFSEDLRRLLAGLPVLAQKDSVFYRASKFVFRNAAATLISTLAIFALIFAAVFSAWQARRANVAQAQAERRFNDVRKLANNVLFEYHDAIENVSGTTEVRQKMLADSLAYLDSLSQEAGGDASLLRELGAAYEKIGTIQGNTLENNIGDAAAMISSYRKCFEIRRRLAALAPGDDNLRRDLAIAYENLGDAVSQTGNLREALENYEAAQKIIAELSARDSKHLRYLARLYDQIASIQGFPGSSNLGQTAQALENERRAVEICEKLYESDPEAKNRFALMLYRRKLGGLLLVAGDANAAFTELNLALPLAESWVREAPDDSTAQETLVLTYEKLSDALAESGNFAEAEKYLKSSIDIEEKMQRADPKDSHLRDGLGILYGKMGSLLSLRKQFAEAKQFHLQSLKLHQENATNSKTTDYQVSLADAFKSYAQTLGRSGELLQAKESYEKALEICEAIVAIDSNNKRVLVNTTENQIGLGDIFAKEKKVAEALAQYQKALPVLETQVNNDQANALLQRNLQDLRLKITAMRNK